MTSTIWEIKYGDEPRIKAHFESKDRSETGQPTKEISIAEGPSENSEQSYFVEQISSFVTENASFCKKIELFWPHSLLQVIILIFWFSLN